MRTWRARYFYLGYLGFQHRRSMLANAQIMTNETPAPRSTSIYHDLCIHASTSVLRSRHAEIITLHRRRQTGNFPSIELKVEAIDAISVWKPRQQGIDGRCISVILAPCRRGSGGSGCEGYRLTKNCQSVLTPFTLRLRICNSLPTCTT